MKYRNLILALATVGLLVGAQISSAHASGFLGSALNDLGIERTTFTCCFGPCWPKLESEFELTREMRDRWLRSLRDQGIIVD